MNTKTLRRLDRVLPDSQARTLLAMAEYGTLATVSPDGSPYVVPVNFVLDGERIVIHGALVGQKIENLRHRPQACFCVVGKTEVLPEEFSTRYESLLVFGSTRWVESPQEKTDLLKKLAKKYAPDSTEKADAMIQKHLNQTAVILLTIESLTGKHHA